MKIEIEKKEFLNIIKEVNEIIISNNYIFALTGILIEVKNNSLIITGSSNNLFIFKTIREIPNLNIIEDGKILVKSSLLFEIINKLNNGILYIAATENNLLIIKDEKSRFELTTIDPENYPILQLDETINGEFKVSGKLFKKYLKTSLASVNEYSLNQIYKSVNLSMENDRLCITSTDSFRITKINTNIKVIGEINQLISNKTIREIIKLLTEEELHI
jgi:DNA polymerase-3 subunit beta